MTHHIYTLTGQQTVDASADPLADTDTFQMSGKKNLATGHDGVDTFNVSGKLNTVHAGLGNDYVSHTAGFGGVFDGGGGNDSLFGLSGDEFIGGDGTDFAVVDITHATQSFNIDLSPLANGGEFDLPDGTKLVDIEFLGIGLGSGADTVNTGENAFVIVNGGAGSDTLTGGSHGDNLYGGAGADTLSGGDGPDNLFAFAPSSLYSIPSGKDDHNGHDSLSGGDSNDNLFSSHGSDTLDGGAGNDTADYEFNVGNGITVKLVNGGGTATGDGVDTLISIESINGSNQDDSITGDRSANMLYGADGADTLEGGRGADSLYGGASDGKVDTFVYKSVADSSAGAQDIIGQFETGLDRIDLHLIDADGQAGNGDTAFSFGNHLGHAGDAMLTYDGTYSHILGDTNGDGTADLMINIQGQIAVSDIIV